MRIYNFNTGRYPFDQYFKKLYDIDSLENIHTLHNSSVVFDMQNNSDTELHKVFYSDIKK